MRPELLEYNLDWLFAATFNIAKKTENATEKELARLLQFAPYDSGLLGPLLALGKPAILIPYPYAIGDHQARNAGVLEAEGAARVIPDERLKNGALVKEILSMVEKPEVLDGMAKRCRTLGRPDAARIIARELLKMERSGM